MESIFAKNRAHYNIYRRVNMEDLRSLFPDGKADEMNLCLFSTSGVHGTYTTIEQIEESLLKYGDDAEFGEDDAPEDWIPPHLTVLVIHPRLVCLKYGEVIVRKDDLDFLKGLRVSSHAKFCRIGW